MSITRVSSERARTILNHLVQQRKLMREEAAEDGLLEANRLGIVYWQWQLSRSLSAEQEKTAAAA